MRQPTIDIDSLTQTAEKRWPQQVQVIPNEGIPGCLAITVRVDLLKDVCRWIFHELGYSFAALIAEESPGERLLRYVFYAHGSRQIHLVVRLNGRGPDLPTVSDIIHAADWQERETEDLFGLSFTGHPRLGDFVLHEDWPEGVNPMRPEFDAGHPYKRREPDPDWYPRSIVQAPGSFMMPIGPVYSDAAESAHFLLETVGEDVLRTIPRFFYKYRGVEKIAEGQLAERVVLLAERFSGTSAFAHSLAFCQAVEAIAGCDVPPRAKALRILLAEAERLRHHIGAIAGICNATALAVAASQAGILEEEALRQTGELTGHRYLFGLNAPGGLCRDLPDASCHRLMEGVDQLQQGLKRLEEMLRFTSSFLDRLEEVGVIGHAQAEAYGLVGPIARASGVSRDLRKTLPYGGYESLDFSIPVESDGDGYARLRVLFREAEQSASIIRMIVSPLPGGPILAPCPIREGEGIGWTEAPRGAAFHWVRVNAAGSVVRYRVVTPSFVNWHGFHLAAEDYAFQDFPIIMASFGLSIAESDR